MADDVVRLDVEDGIAVVRLNRPEALNALNRAMRERLDEVLREVEAREEVRAVALFGEGRAFCAGQDLKEGALRREPAQHLEEKWAGDFQDRLAALSKPTVVGLQGHVVGRGLEVALTCDIRVAADDAALALPEVALGMLPGSGGSQRCARLIGPGRALHLILTGERIDARTALEWGLVTRVVRPEELRAETMAIARRIAEAAPLAVRFAREVVRRAADMPLAEGLRMEASLSAILLSTEDRAEGVRAFRERRKPVFIGR